MQEYLFATTTMVVLPTNTQPGSVADLNTMSLARDD